MHEEKSEETDELTATALLVAIAKGYFSKPFSQKSVPKFDLKSKNVWKYSFHPKQDVAWHKKKWWLADR